MKWGRRAGDRHRQVPRWTGEHLGEPSGVGGELDDEYDHWLTTDLAGSSTLRAFSSRLAAFVLWALVAAAVLLSLFRLTTPAAGVAPVGPPSASPTPRPPEAGCAELAIGAWLAGNKDQMRAMFQGSALTDQFRPGVRHAERVYTVGVTAGHEPEVWAFTVAADVLVSVDKTWRPSGTQFFQITLARTGGGCQGWTAVGLPAQVAGPSLPSEIELAYRERVPVSSSPLVDTIDGFFRTLLTGADGLDRYTSPDAQIVPVRPAPYEAVRVKGIWSSDEALAEDPYNLPANGTVVRLLVTVDGNLGQQQVPMSYPLSLVARDGRWEVKKIEKAVSIRPSPGPPNPSTGLSVIPATPAPVESVGTHAETPAVTTSDDAES